MRRETLKYSSRLRSDSFANDVDILIDPYAGGEKFTYITFADGFHELSLGSKLGIGINKKAWIIKRTLAIPDRDTNYSSGFESPCHCKYRERAANP